MSTKRLPKGDTKGKVEGSKQVVSLQEMAAGVRAILSNPQVEQSVKRRLDKLVGDLCESVDADVLPVEAEVISALFAEGESEYRDREEAGKLTDKARTAHARLLAFIERHEPKDARLIRRLSKILSDPKNTQARDAVMVALNDLSNETASSDTDPEIFPTMARVLIARGRKFKGRKYPASVIRRALSDLEATADGKPPAV